MNFDWTLFQTLDRLAAPNHFNKIINGNFGVTNSWRFFLIIDHPALAGTLTIIITFFRTFLFFSFLALQFVLGIFSEVAVVFLHILRCASCTFFVLIAITPQLVFVIFSILDLNHLIQRFHLEFCKVTKALNHIIQLYWLFAIFAKCALHLSPFWV
jgi:hypothetical protein